ncbi:hypothetical protein IWW55_004482 [Coemansia sp. RSA 2706]|nr:hypothetical protein IWW55_004482 [Coemansia sp. RSA 2706]
MTRIAHALSHLRAATSLYLACFVLWAPGQGQDLPGLLLPAIQAHSCRRVGPQQPLDPCVVCY